MHRLGTWQMRLLAWLHSPQSRPGGKHPELADLMGFPKPLENKRHRESHMNSILMLEHYDLIRSWQDERPNGCPVTRFKITENGRHYV